MRASGCAHRIRNHIPRSSPVAKRGERLPWKVQYEWTSGIKGKNAYGSQDLAELKAAQIREAGERRPDADVAVEVVYQP